MVYGKDFYEYYAKSILEVVFPEKFSALNKGESPDWYNDKIGIEVTRGIEKSNGEFDSFFNKYRGEEYETISQPWLNKLGFTSEPIMSEDGIFHEQRSEKFGKLVYIKTLSEKLVLVGLISRMEMMSNCKYDIAKSVNEKTEKLNKNYVHHEENDLLILVQEQLNYHALKKEIIDDVSTNIVDEVKKCYNDNQGEYSYDYIYIVFLDYIFVVDSKTFTITEYEISQEIRMECINRVNNK